MKESDDDDVIVVPNDNLDGDSNLGHSQPKTAFAKLNTVFQNNSIEQQLDPDIIDLDGDDRDPLAPLRSVINFVKGNTRNQIKQSFPTREVSEDIHPKLKTNNIKTADVTYHLSPEKKSQNITGMVREDSETDIPVKKYVLFKPSSNKIISSIEPKLVSPTTPYKLVKKIDNLNSDNGNGIFDLNINITNASTPIASSALLNNVSSVDGLQNTTDELQKSCSQYNVALGLVVNINQTTTHHEDIKEKAVGDIAVSLCMSNRGRQPAVLRQAKKCRNTAGNKKKVYSCRNCSFKTIKLQTFNSHVCKYQAVQKKLANECLANDTVSLQHSFCKTVKLGPKKGDKLHKTVTYRCSICSLETNNLKAMREKECLKFHSFYPNKLKELDNKSQVITHDKKFMKITDNKGVDSSFNSEKHIMDTSSSTECSYKYSESEALKKHNCFITKGGDNGYTERKYDCMHCSYSGKCLNDLNTHVCPFKNNLTWNENSHSQSTSQNIDSTCDIFNTLFSKLFKSYEYVGESSVPSPDLALRPEKKSPQYSCLSCPFVTEDVQQVNTHKCQKYSLMYKIDTAVHTMRRKFSFEKVHVCVLCTDQVHFSCGEALLDHYAMAHKGVFTKSDKTWNRCTFCGDIMDDTFVKEHFTSHISHYEDIIKSYFFQDDFVNLINRLGETSLDIQNTSECSDKGQIKCYSCKQNIYISGMKCVNSDCENWYHIQCCNIYGRQLLPQEVTDFPDWFCPNCNRPEDRNISTAVDDIDAINFCLNVADKLLLREMEIQNTMLIAMKEIKEEKQATKEEFAKIKNFIINSKSERINNPRTRAVCSIVEKFLDAGIKNLNT